MVYQYQLNFDFKFFNPHRRQIYVYRRSDKECWLWHRRSNFFSSFLAIFWKRWAVSLSKIAFDKTLLWIQLQDCQTYPKSFSVLCYCMFWQCPTKFVVTFWARISLSILSKSRRRNFYRHPIIWKFFEVRESREEKASQIFLRCNFQGREICNLDKRPKSMEDFNFCFCLFVDASAENQTKFWPNFPQA